MRKIVLAVVLALLVACQPAQTPDAPPVTPTATKTIRAVAPEFDRSDRLIELVVVIHPTNADLNRALDNFAGKDMPEVYGWSGWSDEKDPSNKDLPPQCEIHVTRGVAVDDKNAVTWGHELMHCIYGAYHGERF